MKTNLIAGLNFEECSDTHGFYPFYPTDTPFWPQMGRIAELTAARAPVKADGGRWRPPPQEFPHPMPSLFPDPPRTSAVTPYRWGLCRSLEHPPPSSLLPQGEPALMGTHALCSALTSQGRNDCLSPAGKSVSRQQALVGDVTPVLWVSRGLDLTDLPPPSDSQHNDSFGGKQCEPLATRQS